MTQDFLTSEFFALCQVVFIDLVLAGDNAIIVGMVAAGVAPENRRRVICGGIVLAVLLRIMFAAVTVQLLGVIGLTLAGGLLLLWVCWKLYRELMEQRQEDIGASLLEEGCAVGGAQGAAGADKVRTPKSTRAAMLQIAVADVSMSLDNVLAVAGAAAHHLSALIVGLTLSVILMGIGASLIANVLQKYHWIGYLGLALIAYVAMSMIWRGGWEVWTVAAL